MATAIASARRLRRRPDAGRGDDGGRRAADRGRDQVWRRDPRPSAARGGDRDRASSPPLRLSADRDDVRAPADRAAEIPDAVPIAPPVAAAGMAGAGQADVAVAPPDGAAVRDRDPTAGP